MSINVSGSTFSGHTQIGYTNILDSQIDELRNGLRHEDVGAEERREAAKLLEEMKQKLELGATKPEVAPIWQRIQELLSSVASIAPLLTQIGKALGI